MLIVQICLSLLSEKLCCYHKKQISRFWICSNIVIIFRNWAYRLSRHERDEILKLSGETIFYFIIYSVHMMVHRSADSFMKRALFSYWLLKKIMSLSVVFNIFLMNGSFLGCQVMCGTAVSSVYLHKWRGKLACSNLFSLYVKWCCLFATLDCWMTTFQPPNEILIQKIVMLVSGFIRIFQWLFFFAGIACLVWTSCSTNTLICTEIFK